MTKHVDIHIEIDARDDINFDTGVEKGRLWFCVNDGHERAIHTIDLAKAIEIRDALNECIADMERFK